MTLAGKVLCKIYAQKRREFISDFAKTTKFLPHENFVVHMLLIFPWETVISVAVATCSEWEDRSSAWANCDCREVNMLRANWCLPLVISTGMKGVVRERSLRLQRWRWGEMTNGRHGD